jgi:hypothetical protein
MHFELQRWLHPLPLDPTEIWGFATEWVAVCAALEWLFGRVRPRWLLAALALHLAARPFLVSIMFVPEDGLGAMLAFLLWKTLPEPALCGPWLLVSTVLLRECAQPLSPGPQFSWLPFQMLLQSARGSAIVALSRAAFDYAAILWLSRRRGLSYAKSGAILTCSLAILAVIRRNIPGDALTMTDPAIALLLTLWFSGMRS